VPWLRFSGWASVTNPGFIYPDHVESDLMNSCKCVAIFAPMEVPARA